MKRKHPIGTARGRRTRRWKKASFKASSHKSGPAPSAGGGGREDLSAFTVVRPVAGRRPESGMGRGADALSSHLTPKPRSSSKLATRTGSRAKASPKKGPVALLFTRMKSKDAKPEVDPRITERAQKVREKEERKAFKRAVWMLLVMSVAGIGMWLVYSPYLAVREVVVTGEVSSSAAQQIEGAGVTAGVPMISIDTELLQKAVLSDPWVAEVEVEKEWPNTIRVTVEERYPVAWGLTGKGWRALSLDGVELDVGPEQLMPHITGLAGAVLDLSHPPVAAALAFLESLRPDLRVGTVIEVHGSQLTAVVAGRIVRLGRATDLEDKAHVLGVLVDRHTDPGSVINLFSALRPAVYREASDNFPSSPSS